MNKRKNVKKCKVKDLWKNVKMSNSENESQMFDRKKIFLTY